MGEKMERKSNIELLRVIAICMIMLSHFMSYGLFTEPDAYIVWAGGNLVNRIFSQIFVGGGDIGVGIFFLISGYFLAYSERTRNVIPFIKQVYFYGIVCTCIAIIMKFMNICDVDVYILTSQSLIPLFGTWWFVAVYFILIFLSKAINSIMDKLDNKKILVLVVIVMIWYSVGLIVHSSYYPLLRGVYYYMVGAWIRREKIQCKKSKGIIVFIISWTIYFLLSFFVAGRGGRDSLGVIGDGVRFMQFVIISPVAAISIFLLFKQMEIRTSKIINHLGAASFAVYLFHEAPYNRILLWNHIFVPKRAWETVMFPIYSVFACVCVYSIVLLIEWVRSNLGKLRMKKLYNKKHIG